MLFRSGPSVVVVAEESTAAQQAEEGRVSENALTSMTKGGIEKASVLNPEVGESGEASEKLKPNLEDWIVYSDISMAVALLMSIVAALVGESKTPSSSFDRKQWRKLKKKEQRRKKRVAM